MKMKKQLRLKKQKDARRKKALSGLVLGSLATWGIVRLFKRDSHTVKA